MLGLVWQTLCLDCLRPPFLSGAFFEITLNKSFESLFKKIG